MVSILVIQNEENQAALEGFASAIASSTGCDILVSAPQGGHSNAASNITYLASADGSLGSTLQMARQMAKDEYLMVIDGSLLAHPEQLTTIISQTEGMKKCALSYVAIESSQGIIDLKETNDEGMIALFNSCPQMPALCWMVKKSVLESSEMSNDTRAENCAEAFLQALIVCINQAENTGKFYSTLRGASESKAIALSPPASARRLNQLINSSNIEDLFAQHDWQRHEEESAAACYHTLAAMFIRFGDTTSASECLSIGDTLEDSPRSLALKGLIAQSRGEILAAVANMVSSLQQYEIRKKNNDKHYLSFSPKNLEIINQKLNRGLKALNVRNNEAALQNFAEAVFNFDSFYSQIGLNNRKQAVQ